MIGSSLSHYRITARLGESGKPLKNPQISTQPTHSPDSHWLYTYYYRKDLGAFLAAAERNITVNPRDGNAMP